MAYKINYTGSSKVIRRLCEAVNDLIEHGGGGGTSDYSQLSNKPRINGITLTGNKTSSDLGINIPTRTSELLNDSGFLTGVPIASQNSLGGIKVGNNLSIDANGVLSANSAGSSVEITPTLESGTKIADFNIDGVAGELYAPSASTPSAGDVTYDNSDSELSATDVQGAIDELASDFQDGCDTIAQAVIAKGQTPASNSPADIADAISKIVTAKLGTKVITSNGIYSASDFGFDGYSTVTVNVQSGTTEKPPLTVYVQDGELHVGVKPVEKRDKTLVVYVSDNELHVGGVA